MGKERPTIKSIADAAGVSTMTVSRVLNGHPHILEETRQRVLVAVQDQGFVPNRSARTMRTRKTMTIAAVIPDITNPFYPEFVRGIQDYADGYDYDVIVYNSDGTESKERKILKTLQADRADGLIGAFFHLPPDQASLEIPGVLLTQKPGAPVCVDCVFIDNVAAARRAVDYLANEGHRIIGMLAGDEGVPPHNSRIQGYRLSLETKGLPYDPGLIRHGRFNEEGGYEGMRELLKLPARPTAVFAANDLLALGAMQALREAGLDIPGHLAIVGFDDIPAARWVQPGLTTISQFQYKVGAKAAELLFQRLGGLEVESYRAVEMPFSLIVRESTRDQSGGLK